MEHRSNYLKERIVALLLFSLIFGSCGDRDRIAIGEQNAFEDPLLREMYSLADQREAAALIPYHQHETAAYRRAFARLVGSMPDSVLFEPLSRLLSDPIPYVRLEAAWAIGQYRDTLALRNLESAIRKASIPEVKAELLEAIGKCAHKHAMNFLIRHEPGTALEEAGKLWGIYRAARRGLLREEHMRIVSAHLKAQHDETRLAALHTMQLARPEWIGASQELIHKLAASDPSAEIRTAAVRCIGSMGQSDEILADLMLEEADPLVLCAILQSFGMPAEEPAAPLIRESLYSAQAWVATAAAQIFWEHPSLLAPEELRSLALTATVPEIRAAALRSQFAYDAAGEGFRESWQIYNELLDRYADLHSRGLLLKALDLHEPALDSLLSYLTEPNSMSSAAAQALVKGSLIHPEWRIALRKAFIELLEGGPAGAITSVAEGLTEAHLRPYFIADTAALRRAEDRFSMPGQYETREALRKARLELSGKPYSFSPPAPNRVIDWADVLPISRRAEAQLYTAQGPLRIRLLVEDAPASVGHFCRLANEGFYDALNFHRLVPGFVSQGGCPVGDGYHSVDYSLRSEFSPLRFGQGVIGLASAGKDTEGSQFFITHTGTPRLDGRYTVIGALIEGVELLNSMPNGTVIDSIRVELGTTGLQDLP